MTRDALDQLLLAQYALRNVLARDAPPTVRAKCVRALRAVDKALADVDEPT